jgi:prophage antirepressor-like protein
MADLFSGASAQITPFSFGTHAVRVIQQDGKPWFIASDVAHALGYSSPKDAAEHLDADEKGSAITRTPGGDQRVTIINESGLYALVLRSRKPEARKFAKWVTSEVLPAIRKTGSYSTQPTAIRIESAMKAAHEVAAQVQTAVVRAILNGGDDWKHRRWMFSFITDSKHGNPPVVDAIENDAVVASLKKLAAMIECPGGMMPSNEELANLAKACNVRLAQRMEYQASKKAGEV